MKARTLTNLLNPFLVFTALYAVVAFSEASVPDALLYLVIEALAAALVAGYVLLMRHRRRVGDFWLTSRTERLVPALVLLGVFVLLILSLVLAGATSNIVLLTLSMGLASAAVAALTLEWKASAHCAVAGHAAIAGTLLLGLPGLVFVLLFPAVVWARVTSGAHTLAQSLAGGAIGGLFALLLLL